jgi:hypothetical protein
MNNLREPDAISSTSEINHKPVSQAGDFVEGFSDKGDRLNTAILRCNFETRTLGDAERLEIEERLAQNDSVAHLHLWHEICDRAIQKETLDVTWWSDEMIFAVRKESSHILEHGMRLDNNLRRGIISAKMRIPKEMVNGLTLEEHARSEKLAGNIEAFRVPYDAILAGGSVGSTSGIRSLLNTQECLRLGSESLRFHTRGVLKHRTPLAGPEDSPHTDFMWIASGIMGERLIVPRLFISSGCLNYGRPVGISKLHVLELADCLVMRVQSGLRVHEMIWPMREHGSDRTTNLLLVPPCDTSLANAVVTMMDACGHRALGNLELVVVNKEKQMLCGAPFCEYKGNLTVPTSIQDIAKGIVYVVNRGDTTGLSTQPGTSKWLANLVAEGGKIGGCKADKNCPILYSQPTVSTVKAASLPTQWKFITWDHKESPSDKDMSFPPTYESRLSVNEFTPAIHNHRTPLSHAESKGLYKLGGTLDSAEEEWIEVLDTTSLRVRNLRKREKYVAVSYTWADYNDDDTQSMVSMVREFTGATAVWIDKLCVPKDEAMRQSVLSAMGLIYNRADLVFVMLTKMQSKLKVSIRDENQIFNWRTDKEANLEFLQEYCARGWRTRVWTAQEGILSRAAIAVTAEHVTWLSYLEALAAGNMMGWSDMTHVSLASNDDCTVVSSKSHFSGPHAFTNTIMAGGGCLGGIKRSRWTLAEAIRSTVGRQCAEEEDRVYGVLGLLGEAGHSVIWKYGFGWRRALLEATKVVGITPMWMTTMTAGSGEGMCRMPDSLEGLEKAVSANVFHEEESEVVLRVIDTGVKVEGAMSLGVITALVRAELIDSGWIECVVDNGHTSVLLEDTISRRIKELEPCLVGKSLIVLMYKGSQLAVGVIGATGGDVMHATLVVRVRLPKNWEKVARLCPIVTIRLDIAADEMID